MKNDSTVNFAHKVYHHSNISLCDILFMFFRDDVRDKFEEIKHLMEEGKTNHVVKLPDPGYEQLVIDNIKDIEKIIELPGNHHAEAFARATSLKGAVKEELYKEALTA